MNHTVGYPKIGSIRKRIPRNRCKICGETGADRRIDVEVSRMRGDDYVFVVHQKCIDNKTKDEIITACFNSSHKSGGY